VLKSEKVDFGDLLRITADAVVLSRTHRTALIRVIMFDDLLAHGTEGPSGQHGSDIFRESGIFVRVYLHRGDLAAQKRRALTGVHEEPGTLV
jgi:hypothetical protein